MKYITLLLITLLISSCCGTKRVAEKTANQDTKEIAQVEINKLLKQSQNQQRLIIMSGIVYYKNMFRSKAM